MDVRVNEFRSKQFYFFITEEINEFKRYQDYKYRFPNHIIKHIEIEWSLIRRETEVLQEFPKDEIAKALGVSDISEDDLKHETTAPLVFKECEKLIKHDEYGTLIWGYTRSIIQDFESYLGTGVDLTEDDIQLI